MEFLSGQHLGSTEKERGCYIWKHNSRSALKTIAFWKHGATNGNRTKVRPYEWHSRGRRFDPDWLHQSVFVINGLVEILRSMIASDHDDAVRIILGGLWPLVSEFLPFRLCFA
jgi:hypothetical protein